MVHSDERFKSFMYTVKNKFLCIQKNILNRREYEKMINTWKLRVFNSFPSIYHLLNSDKWLGSYGQKTAREKQSEVQAEMYEKSNFFTECSFEDSVSR
jgi:hypothetical protein